ncbi:4-(cytidine 5'-diphospho)-2-C-methyl-D-erythritol kinase [Telmatospirillum siberiense]|uniref:4-diphosphocytidyl-2-C-methyl-D-erythritol kinase n=1 Tax=Telmatospirillum siberiense TaxID=382514 RepID=A0A2N3PTQ0_9PROT|nr:4-(cytidine 5'-diphospho)-2-C-methyl-D-erythritol kinase [Telmatospirillum siberiense]PKU23782.1 4-(cytidine 5'-diphospho)-2-C-methyl-D-erythritol kinase [Telmatospirillum siberiense]
MTQSLSSRPAGDAVESFAAAKINLYLHVTGRRDDGYHLLDSLVAFAGVGDLIRVGPSDDLSLAIDGPNAGSLAAEPDNIVLRAARALAAAAGVPAKAAITLTKRLPVASGIGGGSADGAATLRGLCRLWGVSPDETELARIGLSLGADLPVCLAGRPMQMAGIGEVLAAAPNLPPAWLVLVNPRVGLSTPAVFKARQAVFSAQAPLVGSPSDAHALASALAERGNDLTEPAVRLLPVIGDVLAAIAGQPSCLLARMSGSGATCFGLFADRTGAEEAARQLALGHADWWVAAAPLVIRGTQV